MWPVFSVNRAGNLTEETANKYLSELYTAFKIKTAMLIVGIIVFVLGVLGVGFGAFKLRKLKKVKGDDAELLE
jgi:hypothetical protein